MRSYHGKYAVAEANGAMNANRPWEQAWEKFDVVSCAPKEVRRLPSCIGLKSHHGRYVVAEANGVMNANRGHFLTWERFVPKYHGSKVTLRSYHGKYAVAEANGAMNANR